LPHHPPAGEVVISMRPVIVFADGPGKRDREAGGRPARPVAAGHPGGDGAAVAARVTTVPDRGAAGLIRKIISVLGGRTPAAPAAGPPEHLPDPISQAEARVLRLLQTSLSAPEIAASFMCR
jgi:hypothetical protein